MVPRLPGSAEPSDVEDGSMDDQNLEGIQASQEGGKNTRQA